MVSAETHSVIERAKSIYCSLQAMLEECHRSRFVSIEPDSGEFFLGDSFDEAVQAARFKYPDRISHTIRIGHATAIHLGQLQ
jgi:hypothetical protein